MHIRALQQHCISRFCPHCLRDRHLTIHAKVPSQPWICPFHASLPSAGLPYNGHQAAGAQHYHVQQPDRSSRQGWRMGGGLEHLAAYVRGPLPSQPACLQLCRQLHSPRCALWVLVHTVVKCTTSMFSRFCCSNASCVAANVKKLIQTESYAVYSQSETGESAS